MNLILQYFFECRKIYAFDLVSLDNFDSVESVVFC